MLGVGREVEPALVALGDDGDQMAAHLAGDALCLDVVRRERGVVAEGDAVTAVDRPVGVPRRAVGALAHRVAHLPVGLKPQPLGLQRGGAAAGEGVAGHGQVVGAVQIAPVLGFGSCQQHCWLQ